MISMYVALVIIVRVKEAEKKSRKCSNTTHIIGRKQTENRPKIAFKIERRKEVEEENSVQRYKKTKDSSTTDRSEEKVYTHRYRLVDGSFDDQLEINVV